jgi:elongation factor P
MYDTSDIRKGLKVLMDGNPYTVIEFQFIKPGKGAAFTRTKFKNLLTGAVVERNIRSGEKLEPANVDQRDMQFLYK